MWLFFFFSFQNFVDSIWFTVWERAPGWLKSYLVAVGRDSEALTLGECQWGWALEAPRCAWGWGFWRDTHQTQLGEGGGGEEGGQPPEVNLVFATFLMSFPSLFRKWLSRNSLSLHQQSPVGGWGGCGSQIQKAPDQVFSNTLVASMASGSTSLILGWLLHILREGTPWSHLVCHGGNSSLEWDRYRRLTDACWPGELGGTFFRGGNSEESGSSWSLGNKELKSQSIQMQRMSEKMVLKIATRKEVGGWLETGRRGIPECVPSKHCWSKAQIPRTAPRPLHTA